MVNDQAADSDPNSLASVPMPSDIPERVAQVVERNCNVIEEVKDIVCVGM